VEVEQGAPLWAILERVVHIGFHEVVVYCAFPVDVYEATPSLAAVSTGNFDLVLVHHLLAIINRFHHHLGGSVVALRRRGVLVTFQELLRLVLHK
jgi:hypothetical protein